MSSVSKYDRTEFIILLNSKTFDKVSSLFAFNNGDFYIQNTI